MGRELVALRCRAKHTLYCLPCDRPSRRDARDTLLTPTARGAGLPSVPVGHFETQRYASASPSRRAAIASSRSRACRPEGRRRPPVVQRARTQCAHFAEQIPRAGVGERDGFDIHDRRREAARHQHVPEVMHVDERHRLRMRESLGDRRPKFLQRIGTEAAEHEQAVNAQHTLPLGKDHVRSRVPMKHQVREHEIRRLVGKRQASPIRDNPQWRSPPPPCKAERTLLPVTATSHHWEGEVHTDPVSIRVDIAQFAAGPPQPAANVEHASWSKFDVLQAADQSPPDFAQQEVMHGHPPGAPVKLAAHGLYARLHPGRCDDTGREIRTAWAERHDGGQYRDARWQCWQARQARTSTLQVIAVVRHSALERAGPMARAVRSRARCSGMRAPRGGFLSVTGASRRARCAVRLETVDAMNGHCLSRAPGFDSPLTPADSVTPASGAVGALQLQAWPDLAVLVACVLAVREPRLLHAAQTIAVLLSQNRETEARLPPVARARTALCPSDRYRAAGWDRAAGTPHGATTVAGPERAPLQRPRRAQTDRRRAEGRRAVEVQDVVTTGSTVDENAAVLKHAGAARVMNRVVARTP